MVVGDERVELAPGMAVRVGAAQLRNFLTADEPFQMLRHRRGPGASPTPPRRSPSSAPAIAPGAMTRQARRRSASPVGVRE